MKISALGVSPYLAAASFIGNYMLFVHFGYNCTRKWLLIACTWLHLVKLSISHFLMHLFPTELHSKANLILWQQ